jgi:hypothetical protein
MHKATTIVLLLAAVACSLGKNRRERPDAGGSGNLGCQHQGQIMLLWARNNSNRHTFRSTAPLQLDILVYAADLC